MLLYLNKQRKIFLLVFFNSKIPLAEIFKEYFKGIPSNRKCQPICTKVCKVIRFIRYFAVFIVSGAICSCIRHTIVMHRALVPLVRHDGKLNEVSCGSYFILAPISE